MPADDAGHVRIDAGVIAAVDIRPHFHRALLPAGRAAVCEPRGVIEKQTSGVLPLVKLQPLSPNELTQPRSSARSRFSVLSLMMPSAPAAASALFEPRCTEHELALQVRRATHPCRRRTTSVTTPPAGVGPLHMQMDAGTF